MAEWYRLTEKQNNPCAFHQMLDASPLLTESADAIQAWARALSNSISVSSGLSALPPPVFTYCCDKALIALQFMLASYFNRVSRTSFTHLSETSISALTATVSPAGGLIILHPLSRGTNAPITREIFNI